MTYFSNHPEQGRQAYDESYLADVPRLGANSHNHPYGAQQLSTFTGPSPPSVPRSFPPSTPTPNLPTTAQSTVHPLQSLGHAPSPSTSSLHSGYAYSLSQHTPGFYTQPGSPQSPSQRTWSYERRSTGFKIRPKKFFSEGKVGDSLSVHEDAVDCPKVFITLWSEPAGGSDVSKLTGVSNGLYGEAVFSKIRRFVIIRADSDSCTALPIKTYGGQGVAKKGVVKGEHAIIYTGRRCPNPHPGETPSREEEGLLPQSIRVDPDDPEDKLDEMSRLDFSRVYTIEYNVKAKSVGKVNRQSEQALHNQFELVWSRKGKRLLPSLSTVRPSEKLPALAEPETVEAVSIEEWIKAFGYLRADGFSDVAARMALRPRPGSSGKPMGDAEPTPESSTADHMRAFRVLIFKCGYSEEQARAVLAADACHGASLWSPGPSTHHRHKPEATT